MLFLKSLIPGFLLAFVVANVVGRQGSKGAFLNIFQFHYQNHSSYWSWPLFIAGTVLAYAIFKSME
jgi:hypothetical protein